MGGFPVNKFEQVLWGRGGEARPGCARFGEF